MPTSNLSSIPVDTLRHDWRPEEVVRLYQTPLLDLVYEARAVHLRNFPSKAIQLSTLVSIKTGACSEDCAYCSQSIRYETGLEPEPLMPVSEVLSKAREALDRGATRFCMGAAWRGLKDRHLGPVVEMVKGVKALGMETCMTLGMLSDEQVQELKAAGLDYYNHNLDTSPEYYVNVVTTHSYQDRLDTLERVRNAGISVCSGGILGLGESRTDRIGLLLQLANLPRHPESVPINMLVRVEGTPLDHQETLDAFELVRTIAVARILMPQSVVRLSAGRENMSDELHALCFMGGANSIFYGDRLLTTGNATSERDRTLFQRLGLEPVTLTDGPRN